MSTEPINRNIFKKGGVFEIVFAIVICSIILLVPIFVIHTKYSFFVLEHGEINEGAVGAGLLLAVVFRTVSRTILRTVIRTSARAGMRASLKGAIKNTARSAARSQSRKLLDPIQRFFSNRLEKNKNDTLQEINHQNLKSLGFASVLLYLSWVIVIGFGQPFSTLLNKDDSMLLSEQESIQERQRLTSNLTLAIVTHEHSLETEKEREKLAALKVDLKNSRDLEKQTVILDQIALQAAFLSHVVSEEETAKLASGFETFDPDAVYLEFQDDKEAVLKALTRYGRFQNWTESTKSSVSKDVENYLDVQLELFQKVWGDSSLSQEISFELSTLETQFKHQLLKQLLVSDVQKVLTFVNNKHDLQYFPLFDWVLTYPPFPAGELVNDPNDSYSTSVIQKGRTEWDSFVIWLGGLIVIIPLWVIYLAQWGMSRKLNLRMYHETGIDGGLIQLYFAGAFSFMPLTSDVIVDCDSKNRYKIAVTGILTSCVFAVLFWLAGKLFVQPILVFTAEAFMLYPMVQCFPLAPLEGGFIWNYSKLKWGVIFSIVMGIFMILGSEGLNYVI